MKGNLRGLKVFMILLVGLLTSLSVMAETKGLEESVVTALIKEGYTLASNEAIWSEKGQSITEIVVNLPVDRVIGYHSEDYVEYLPFNYDEKEQRVEVFTNKEEMLIVPLYEEKNEVKKNVSTTTYSALSIIPDEDRYFNIIKNKYGEVTIQLETLYDETEDYYYKVYIEDNLFKDKTDLTSDMIVESFSERGIYRFDIYKENTYWFDEKLWEAEIYVEPNPLTGSTKEMLNHLAITYAPILTFSEDEVFKPISLIDIFSNGTYEIALNTQNGTKRMPLTVLMDYIRYNGYAKGLLEGHWGLGTVSDSLEHMPIDDFDSSIYYSMVETSQAYLINYHFIYNFDSKTPTTSIAAHNFDREQISITFNKNTMLPEKIYYPQHLIDSSMGLLSDDGDDIYNIESEGDLMATWEGYTVMDFDDAVANDLVVNNTHLIISIAEGSHAPYPLSGLYVASNFNEPAGIGRDVAIEAERFLIPANLYNQLPTNSDFQWEQTYQLIPLDIDNITSGEDKIQETNLLAFCGYWVDIVGLDNVKFPPFIEIMKYPEAYINETMKERSHTFTFMDIPTEILDRTSQIKAYLENQL